MARSKYLRKYLRLKKANTALIKFSVPWDLRPNHLPYWRRWKKAYVFAVMTKEMVPASLMIRGEPKTDHPRWPFPWATENGNGSGIFHQMKRAILVRSHRWRHYLSPIIPP